MVVKDFYDLLITDTKLSSLLGATVTDSKIYPLQMALNSTLPIVVYRAVDEGTLDENINEAVVHFDCISDNYATAKLIQDRIQELLDIDNGIDDRIPYGYNKYFYSKMEMTFNFKEPILDIFHYIVGFLVKYFSYKFLLQENGSYLLQENGGYIKL